MTHQTHVYHTAYCLLKEWKMVNQMRSNETRIEPNDEWLSNGDDGESSNDNKEDKEEATVIDEMSDSEGQELIFDFSVLQKQSS